MTDELMRDELMTVRVRVEDSVAGSVPSLPTVFNAMSTFGFVSTLPTRDGAHVLTVTPALEPKRAHEMWKAVQTAIGELAADVAEVAAPVTVTSELVQRAPSSTGRPAWSAVATATPQAPVSR